MGKSKNKHHTVKSAEVKSRVLFLSVDGMQLEVDLDPISPLFAQASAEELKVLEISPSGYGIHWPMLDEDISIDGLLGVCHQPGSKGSTAWL